MSAKKSLAWRYFYFKDGEKEYVECSMCQKRLAYKGSTTSMIKHIIAFHSHETKKTDRSEKQSDNVNCLVEENNSEDEVDFGTRIRRSLEKQTQKRKLEVMERSPVCEERNKKPETNVDHPKEQTLPSSEALSKTLNISGALDQFDHFGQNIACKLREMDKEQRILAEKLMSDAIFYGQLGQLTVQSAEAFPQILSPNVLPYSSF